MADPGCKEYSRELTALQDLDFCVIPSNQGDGTERPALRTGSIRVTESGPTVQQKDGPRPGPHGIPPDLRFDRGRNQADTSAMFGVFPEPRHRIREGRIHKDTTKPLSLEAVVTLSESRFRGPRGIFFGGARIQIECPELVQDVSRREPCIDVDVTSERGVSVIADPLRDKRHRLWVCRPSCRAFAAHWPNRVWFLGMREGC